MRNVVVSSIVGQLHLGDDIRGRRSGCLRDVPHGQCSGCISL